MGGRFRPQRIVRLTLAIAASSALIFATQTLSQAVGQTAEPGTGASKPIAIDDGQREGALLISEHRLAHSDAHIQAIYGPSGYPNYSFLNLTLLVAPDGHVISARPLEDAAQLLRRAATPRLATAPTAAEISAIIDKATRTALTWKYVPFEKDGKAVYATFWDSIDLLPPERRPETRASFPEVKAWNSARITLARSLCEGRCPAYSVEVRGDGTVIYNGSAYVAVGGQHRGHISQEVVRDLVSAFRAADYYWAFDRYRSGVIDYPIYRTSITIDGVRKSIVDDDGSHDGLPAAIADLEDAIDKAAGTQKWIKITDETLPSLVAEGYFKKRERNTSLLATMIGEGASAAMIRQPIMLGAPLNNAAFDGTAEGQTPLMVSADRGDVEIVQVLLSAGAGRNSKRQMSRALHSSARDGSPDLVRLFLGRGADPNYQDQFGRTVLMNAVWSAVPETVATIISAGGDVNAKDRDGTPVLDYTRNSIGQPAANVRQTVRLLLEAGARVTYDNICLNEAEEVCTEVRNWVREHPRPTGR